MINPGINKSELITLLERIATFVPFKSVGHTLYTVRIDYLARKDCDFFLPLQECSSPLLVRIDYLARKDCDFVWLKYGLFKPSICQN